MTVQAIIGGQWGDEGKGKIVDILAADADAIVRYQGGANAGHTVVVGDQTYKLHLVPSGILHPGKQAIIGNGVVVDPEQLLKEIEGLAQRGISCSGRLFISERAHIVFPYHRALDELLEGKRGGQRLDTTKRGIGPAYTDKVARMGIRAGDLVRPDRLRQRLAELLPIRNAQLAALGGRPFTLEEIFGPAEESGRRLAAMVVDTVTLVQDLRRSGKRIILEGAQGGLLDIDFGTYPFVTSSSTNAGGIATGVGLPPRAIDRIIGVFKAYTTRVGSGPFPTEESGALGQRLREIGVEYGTTTGRPRRCGWFDAVAARWVADLNGIDAIALTKLDVLGAFDEIKICVGYELDGQRLRALPPHAWELERVVPIYETMPGWRSDLSGIRRLEDLPPATAAYCRRLSDLIGVGFDFISTGPAREATIHTRAK